MMSFFTKLRWLCICLALFSGIQIFTLLLSDLYSPVLFMIKSVAFQTGLVLVLANFFALPLLRPRKIVVGLSVVINLILLSVLLNKYSFSKPELAEQNSYELLTFSALTRTRNGEDIKSYLDKSSVPDLLCLQEVLIDDTAFITDYFQSYLHKEGNTLAIASRWPIEEIYASGRVQIAKVQSDFGELLVVNVHMPRPYRTPGVDDDWARLFETISVQAPAILCGDFNITPFSSFYDQITAIYGYEDAHKKASGFGFTFPYKQRRMARLGPQFRIDYLFTKSLIPLQSETVEISELSDHKAVKLRFLSINDE